MIRVMVVDDEMRIRNGISKYIEQNIDGFSVACCLRDGEDAIAYLAEEDVDIIVSDIRMLKISGIELAKYVYENKPYIKMIMLSGYQEFEYAQSAIAYGVSAYLLKPTDFKELTKTLQTAAQQLKKNADNLGDFIDNTKAMFALILEGKAEEGRCLLEKVFEQIGALETGRVGKYIYDFFEILYDKIGLHMKIDLKAQGIGYENLAQYDTVEKIREQGLELLGNIFKLTKTEDDSEDYILKRAKDYINENFSKDLSLQEVADYVYLNPVYFSRLFKKRTGQNFSDYLLNKRMTHAAKLLLDNRKVAEVSEACGYNNSGYFARIFKEYYKCTPKEYGRKNRDKE